MRTPLCDLLDIEIPIVQAPIITPVGAPAGPMLAAAVSDAGGLGMMALWLAAPDALRSSVSDVEKAIDNLERSAREARSRLEQLN